MLTIYYNLTQFNTVLHAGYHVLDEEVPKLHNLPNNISVPTNVGQAFARVNWTEPNATDNSGVVTVSSDIKSGSLFYIGTTNVTYTAVDPSGNAAEYNFIVTVAGQYVDFESFCSTYIGLKNLPLIISFDFCDI